jgi:hypothetical protein
MIEFLENVLTLDTIKAVHEEVYSQKNERKWRTSNQSWTQDLTRDSLGTILIHDMDLDCPVAKEIWRQLTKYIDPQFKNLRSITYTEWQPMSLINWHDDGHSSSSNKQGVHMTIYLNDKWEWNWGGLFCWKDGQDHKVKCPQFNHGLTVSKGHQHCVTVLSPKAPVRKTLQIIITNYE